jgi:hypothetical protein
VLSDKTSSKTIRLPPLVIEKPPRTKQYSFWLSEIVNQAIEDAAKASDCTRSQVLEYLLCPDLTNLIPRFEAGEPFSRVLSETRLPPSRIREAYAQWKQGYESRLVESPVATKLKAEIQKKRLEVKEKALETQERITSIKAEAKRDVAKTRMDIEEIKAGSKARELRTLSLSRSRFAK